MKNISSWAFWAFCKKPAFILSLILIVFFLKGLFLVAIFPIFGGQDESRHYNTVQYLAEPEEKTWERSAPEVERNKDHIETYGFSEEIRQTAMATDTAILRGEIFNTINFSDEYAGKNESAITSGQWKPYNYNPTPEVVGGSLYHTLSAFIEKVLGQEDILVRFFTLRVFSVLLGTLAILFFYFTAKTAGISSRHSLLLSAIIAFQPKLSMYFSNINYDVLLIPLFFLFTIAGTLALRDGLNWKNGTLLILSTFLATETKATGYILLIAFFALLTYFVHIKVQERRRQVRYVFYFLCTLVFAYLAFYLKKYLPAGEQSLTQLATSVFEYLSKSLSFGRFGLTERTYWGTLGWTNSWLLDNAVEMLKYLEIIALVGLAFFFFGKHEKPSFLPEKKYIIFFILMVAGLQMEIRVADWSLFNRLGKIELGTPGRYFLPNLASHMILMFTGLGMLFAYLKRERYFEKALLAGLISMFSLSLYLIFNVIIYRFYL